MRQSLRKKKGKRAIGNSILDDFPSFELLPASQQSLSEISSAEEDNHDKRCGERNKILCVGSLLRPVRERFLSNVYDVEAIVEANPALEIFQFLK